MSRKNQLARTAARTAVALSLLWLVLRRNGKPGYMPGWEKVIQERYGFENARYIISDVRRELSALYAETPMPNHQVLRWHLAENILPGLALYRVLLKEHNGNREAALASFDCAVHAWTIARSRFKLMPLRILPAPFSWFRLVLPQVMKQYPAEGWDIAYVDNNKERVAFDITRCYYLDTLTALHAPELTASFCKGDDVMAELFPEEIRFVRPHTLGRGDMVCDFQYCRERLNV